MRNANILIIILFLATCVNTQARTADQPLFTWGAEWDCCQAFFMHCHYNYISTDGFRVNTKATGFTSFTNASISVRGGINFTPKDNLSLYATYCGLGKGYQALATSLRWTHCIGMDPTKDRWLYYIQGGFGRNPEEMTRTCLVARCGGGYKLVLSRSVKLDLLSGLQFSMIHPELYESHNTGGAVDKELIRRNNYLPLGLVLGIGLDF